MSFTVEYLVTLDETADFCKDVAGLNNLLRTIDGLKVSNSEIRLGTLTVGYEVEGGSISNDKQRFFHLRLTLSEEARLSDFEALLRSIRSVLHKVGSRPPQMLWDGVSSYYADLAYPQINEIENLLRKLITKFMLTNVGLGWTTDYVPKEVAESVKVKDPTGGMDYLYQTDFIQLSNFLFKEYSTISAQVLLEKVKKATNISHLDLTELKEAIPQSNWDRYFSKIVKCESDYLRVRWQKLYDRRNQVAHNRSVNRSEYNEIVQLCTDLRPKFEEAVESLQQVSVDESGRDSVSANIAIDTNTDYKEFLLAWTKLHGTLVALTLVTAKTEPERAKILKLMMNIRNLLNTLRANDRISSEPRERVIELLKLRNVMVHYPDVIVPESTLAARLLELTELTTELGSKTSLATASDTPAEPKVESDLEVQDGVYQEVDPA
jgi:hypothetical protein